MRHYAWLSDARNKQEYSHKDEIPVIWASKLPTVVRIEGGSFGLPPVPVAVSYPAIRCPRRTLKSQSRFGIESDVVSSSRESRRGARFLSLPAWVARGDVGFRLYP